jgi:hypothetical protein
MGVEYAQYDEWVYNRWYDFYASRAGVQPEAVDVFSLDAVASRFPPDE